ncbi:Piso0_003973 [Millerozyma farinosa CBS 7064]|uniref:Piso0_003973 protein n=1 Tax=Pichia sorbitophila (strain ATCC MYA-4447 / BCRC 22081 / CBS 7064 / NBRC 10061 / NRRL Y-12695) TaxID=559304 RepID=G8Y749_PICSO|nr:Piso0_003973 [Millerozyma farinosa CBS 7064]CCE84429.1 Piso0_003973 [Millerozyma farinosa CBS 7064]
MESDERATPPGDESIGEIEKHNLNVDITTLPIYTRSQLAQFNGTDRPQTYVAIRGYIYDVSSNAKNYGPGKSYHRLVGKDVTRLFGLNTLSLTSARSQGDSRSWYTGDFTAKENAAVDSWVSFFRKRYPIVGLVVDHDSG